MEAEAKKSDELKKLANEAFGGKHFARAVALYTSALEAQPSAILYANRAAAHLALENCGAALADAESSILLDAAYIKAYYRRAAARFLLGKHAEALQDYRYVVKLKPTDKDAQAKFKECDKVVKALRFAKAISQPDEDEGNVADSIDVASMVVEPSYSGARLADDDNVTLEFVKQMIQDFRDEKILHRRYAFVILLRMKAMLLALPTVVDVPVPEGKHITVCGDVHGQFYDLLNIFELNGLPSDDHPYLFNGDFVDRGSFSVEVIFTLMALKCLYPTGLYMTRGNHETRAMNSIYGFEGEVRAKYNDTMAKLFAEVFRCLPLGAVLGEKVFVVHGGLFSRDDVTLDELRTLDRFREPPDEGPMCEMLWSDPQPGLGRAPSKRGVGVAFGADVTKNFLQRNNLQLVVRSHEVKEEGFMVEHDGCCITIFSAPNYCDSMGNKGAFIRFESDMVPHFTSFDAVPHPAVRPMRFANPMLQFM